MAAILEPRLNPRARPADEGSSMGVTGLAGGVFSDSPDYASCSTTFCRWASPWRFRYTRATRSTSGWYAVAQLFAWTVHVITHYCNEYFDLEASRANVYFTAWTGGSQALVDGLVAPVVSLGAGVVLLSASALMVTVMPSWQARVPPPRPSCWPGHRAAFEVQLSGCGGGPP